MSNEPNYAALNPPEDDPPEEWSWADRRAEIFDLIESAGHYRKLQKSQRELARHYDVALSTIQNDIQRVNEFIADHCGEDAKHELETLKNSAIDYYLENNEPDKAYYLMNTHYEILMKAGLQDKAPDEHEISGSGGGPIEVIINDQVIDTDDEHDDEN